MSSGLCGFCKQRKAELIALLMNVKVAQVALFLWLASQFASVDTIPNASKVTTFDKKFFSYLRLLNWCDGFPDTQPLGLALLVS